MDNMPFNGWTNQPTWNVCLWLDNDEWAYTKVRQFLAFLASRTTGKSAMTLAEEQDAFLSFIRSQVFSKRTPDGVPIGPKDDAVDWPQVIEHYAEHYAKLRQEWQDIYERRMAEPPRQRYINESATAFRNRHSPPTTGSWTLADMAATSTVHAHLTRNKRS